MRLKAFLLFLLFVLFISSLAAKDNSNKVTITGTVLDANENPVAGAIVLIDNQKTNSITDSEGNYKIKVKSDASMIGILTFRNGYFEEEIGGRDRIDIRFRSVPSFNTSNNAYGEKEINGSTQNSSNYGIMELRGRSVAPGEEAVEVGYATMKKKYLTTDITYIDGSKKKYASYRSIYEMIEREVSGVMITGKKIVIQGSGSFIGSSPLIIIDGAYADVESLDNIPASCVASISVLKGTSAAIYGSRGFGGAIIVKTKLEVDY